MSPIEQQVRYFIAFSAGLNLPAGSPLLWALVNYENNDVCTSQAMMEMAVPKFSRELGRVSNLNKSRNWHDHIKDHAEIGHLTKYACFKGEQRPSYGPWWIADVLLAKRHSGRERRRTAVFAGYCKKRSLVKKEALEMKVMSRIERKYCLIDTSYLAELFDVFILLHTYLTELCVFWWLLILQIRTLCDSYHNEFESH